jgi:hypothetical protein
MLCDDVKMLYNSVSVLRDAVSMYCDDVPVLYDPAIPVQCFAVFMLGDKRTKEGSFDKAVPIALRSEHRLPVGSDTWVDRFYVYSRHH